MLYFDGTGLLLLTKRLLKGCFDRPWFQAGVPIVELTVAELLLSLAGCELAGRWKLLPPAFEEERAFGGARRAALPRKRGAPRACDGLGDGEADGRAA